jgi:hypothetical protein
MNGWRLEKMAQMQGDLNNNFNLTLKESHHPQKTIAQT